MASHDWYLTRDIDDFLARAGDFLRAEPAVHTVQLTVTETLRMQGARSYGDGAPEFGVLEQDGKVRAAFFRTPPHRLCPTPLSPAEADALACLLRDLGDLGDLGQSLPGVQGDQDTAAAFADAWRRRTGAEVTLHQRQRLYRLGELTVPQPVPPGRARTAGPEDRAHLSRWYRDFCAAVGDPVFQEPEAWADARIEQRAVTYWEDPEGELVAMACLGPQVAGQVRVSCVYTPPALRRRGYAGAATAEASRTARERGAEEVLLFTDLANPTSNALYQRIGYRPVSDFAVYSFS
ncbi:GNAT family N-acetyltransferase [Streptomyces thermospinosisporus]|uniref:GNAT family N-acetyltransferase n=1 Tax=Streptomyces thermospinosisporus TaxID=161482 RepID=A0ABP4JY30_9ACTN